SKEIDLSWHVYSLAGDLSSDGRTVLINEEQSGGAAGAVYLRGTDGSPAGLLGDGNGGGLSPGGEGGRAMSSTWGRLTLLPTRPGQLRVLPGGGLLYSDGCFFPDGQRLLLAGVSSGRPPRLWIQDVAGGAPRALTPEGFSMGPISPDGRSIATRGPDGEL